MITLNHCYLMTCGSRVAWLWYCNKTGESFGYCEYHHLDHSKSLHEDSCCKPKMQMIDEIKYTLTVLDFIEF